MATAETETAQRYLDAAKTSVDHALQSMRKIRDVRREEEGKGAAGRISDTDMDLLGRRLCLRARDSTPP
jgi:hypothetical protein